MCKKRIVFILNPISGTKRKTSIPDLIDEYIDKAKFDFTIKLTQRAGHASALARESAEEGADIIVAVGGDGTVNEVARAICGTQSALGIIPCGSGNGLARHLMLPLNVKGAMRVINEAVIHDLDYGVINGMPFFCTCGMGFDAYISHKFAMAGKRGPLTYIENVLKSGLTYKPERYVIDDENGSHEYNAFLVSIANASQYGNDAYIAPQASMSDGLMDVIIMEPFDVVEAAQVSYDIMNKTLDENSKVKSFKTKHIRILREKPGYVHYDGDPIMADADLDVSIKEKGIRVVVNKNADKRKRRPTKMQRMLSEIIGGVSEVRDDIVDTINDAKEDVAKDIAKQTKKVQDLNKKILRKLNG